MTFQEEWSPCWSLNDHNMTDQIVVILTIHYSQTDCSAGITKLCYFSTQSHCCHGTQLNWTCHISWQFWTCASHSVHSHCCNWNNCELPVSFVHFSSCDVSGRRRIHVFSIVNCFCESNWKLTVWPVQLCPGLAWYISAIYIRYFW